MRPYAIARARATPADLTGGVLCEDLEGEAGRTFRKGSVLTRADATRILDLEWEELHLIAMDPGDLHEDEASHAIADAVAGEGVTVDDEPFRGQWALRSAHRGLLRVNVQALDRVNRVPDVSVFTHPDLSIVDEAAELGRARVLPFVVAGETVSRVGELASRTGGVVTVRRFLRTPVAAIVQERLDDEGAERFRRNLERKLRWMGSELIEPIFVEPRPDAIAEAAERIAGRAGVLVMAGSRAIDPMDPAFRAMDRLGADMIRYGVPAHPGSFVWLARRDGLEIVGAPSCGLFGKRSAFDLVLAMLLAGERPDSDDLAALGHGGFLTAEMDWRFPDHDDG